MIFKEPNKRSIMKKQIKELIKRTIRRAKDNWRVADLLGDRIDFPDTSFGTFVDSNDEEHLLLPGLRDRLKPGWQIMLQPGAGVEPLTKKVAGKKALYGYERLKKAGELLARVGIELAGGKALELGCFNGKDTYGMVASGVAEAVGSDINAYKLFYRSGSDVDEAGCARAYESIKENRGLIKEAFIGRGFLSREAAEKVTFVEDEPSRLKLEDNSFDWVFSWETLEHVRAPQAVIAEIERILKPGGVLYSMYNPFFTLIGGHALCTLDFPWGHTRLSRSDFKRYIREVRPGEEDLAMNYYDNCLNKMSFSDLTGYLEDRGMEPLLLLPLPDMWHLEVLPESALGQTKAHFPNVTLTDLLSPVIYVIAKKAGG